MSNSRGQAAALIIVFFLGCDDSDPREPSPCEVQQPPEFKIVDAPCDLDKLPDFDESCCEPVYEPEGVCIYPNTIKGCLDARRVDDETWICCE